jgi:hypothetical protein
LAQLCGRLALLGLAVSTDGLAIRFVAAKALDCPKARKMYPSNNMKPDLENSVFFTGTPRGSSALSQFAFNNSLEARHSWKFLKRFLSVISLRVLTAETGGISTNIQQF